MKHGKEKGHLLVLSNLHSTVFSTEHFKSQSNAPDGEVEKVGWKQRVIFGLV